MKSIGREQIDGVNYYVLQLILNDGYAVSLHVDPNSWLVTRRRDVRPLHVDVDPRPTTIEQVSSDFHDVNGVKFPFATAETDLNTGNLLESTITKSVKINPTLPPMLFDKLLTSRNRENESTEICCNAFVEPCKVEQEVLSDDLANCSAYRRFRSTGGIVNSAISGEFNYPRFDPAAKVWRLAGSATNTCRLGRCSRGLGRLRSVGTYDLVTGSKIELHLTVARF
jgi:hypothetical protein